MKFDIEIFNPNKESLRKIVAETKNIRVEIKSITPNEFTLVKDTKNKLVKARTAIQRTGKETREEAIQYQRDVISYEKELIGIIEPEELRLKTIVADVVDYHLKKERRKHLAENKARLATIGDDVTIMDKEILEMDQEQLETYYNQRLADKTERDRQQKEHEVMIQRAKEEGAKGAKEQAEKEKKEAKEKAEKEKADKLADEKYQAFLKKNGYKEGPEFTTIEDVDNIYLYKLVATYQK